MKNSLKKILASLLAAVLIFSAASVNGFAVKSFAEDTSIVETTDDAVFAVTADTAEPEIIDAEEDEVPDLTSSFMVLLVNFVNLIIRFCEAVYDIVKPLFNF